MKHRILALAASALVLLTAGTASAATVPLGSRTLNTACNAAASGDVVTVPAGQYASQTITCTKAVTFKGAGPTSKFPYIAFSNANGPIVDSVYTSGAESKASKNVGIRNSTITNQTYVEGSSDVLFDHDTWEPAASGTTWGNADMLDIYEQTGRPANTRITVQDSVFHGLRATSSTDHPDAIQFCNCGSSGMHAIGVKILRNKFYDNECANVRPAPHVDLTLENNVFGDTVQGVSGCGFYTMDVGFADVTARYNTFTGSQQVQETPTVTGVKQTWIGNAGVGFSTTCGGGAVGGTFSHNVWTGQKCSTTDIQVTSLKLDANGVPTSDSPVVDAGDKSVYPALDFNGNGRFAGAAPDAGAFETSSIGGGTTTPTDPPPPPADADGDGVPDSSDACPTLKGGRSDGCLTPAETIKLAGDYSTSQSTVTSVTKQRDDAQAQVDALTAKIQKALADLG